MVLTPVITGITIAGSELKKTIIFSYYGKDDIID